MGEKGKVSIRNGEEANEDLKKTKDKKFQRMKTSLKKHSKINE